jgi:hypothetical protein
MKKTLFAGLTVLEPGEGLDTDSGAFAGRDRETVDHLLEVGAKTHRHTGLNGLSSPAAALGAAVVASGGTIGADLAVSLGYTLEDNAGGETMLSPVASVSTQPPLEGPQAAPSAAFDSGGGSLMVNTYFYGVTFTDGEGGETPLGPTINVERPPGFASGRVDLSQLNFGLVAAGAKGWRLYRATGGGTFNLLATGSSGEATFVDDGSKSVECSVHPPAGEQNTTLGINTLLVTLPASGALGSATFINLYASISGDFGGGSFLQQFPVASAGHVVAFSKLELTAISPPSVNLSIGGAHQIDPDTELLDWHWKRPVANVGALPASAEEGDTRMVSSFSSPTAYVFHNGKWEPWQAGGSGTTGPWEKMTPLESPWVGTKSPEWPPAFRVKGDTVELAGAVASGANGSTIFTFPVGARPAANIRFGIGEGVNNTGITLEVKTNGKLISINHQSSICYLSGLSFPLGAPPP